MWPHLRWHEEALLGLLGFILTGPLLLPFLQGWLMWIQWLFICLWATTSRQIRPQTAVGIHSAVWCFTPVFYTQIWCKECVDGPSCSTSQNTKAVFTPNKSHRHSYATETIEIHPKCVLSPQFALRIISIQPRPPFPTRSKPFPRLCCRSGNCPRRRGSGSKKKRRCWKRCSTPTSCDFTTFGSRRWRGRSASFWLRSSWPQGRWKRGSIF